jgi:hypothetical protein
MKHLGRVIAEITHSHNLHVGTSVVTRWIASHRAAGVPSLHGCSGRKRATEFLSLIFDGIWLDDGRVIAVQPKPSFLPFFQTQRQKAPKLAGVNDGRFGTKCEPGGAAGPPS